jgi:Tfp pilus assembly protein PilF
MLADVTMLDEALTRAADAYASGDTAQARLSFRAAIDVAPESVAAWLGLSRVTPQLDQRRAALQRVLALDPANAEALAALATVDALIAQGKLLAPPTMLRPAPAALDGDAP